MKVNCRWQWDKKIKGKIMNLATSIWSSLKFIIIEIFRYVILSYIVEFDKIHYPLPLNYEDNNDLDTLKGTIIKLR
jgi:hypothetical protein